MAHLDAFLKFDGIKGEAQDLELFEQIEILGFSWGASAPYGASSYGASSGEPTRRGDCQVQNFTFTKLTDRASAPLLQAVAAPRSPVKALLTVRKAGSNGKPLKYLEILFEKVSVASWDISAAGSDGVLVESVSLTFGKFTVTYHQQAADGAKSSGPISVTHNVFAGG